MSETKFHAPQKFSLFMMDGHPMSVMNACILSVLLLVVVIVLLPPSIYNLPFPSPKKSRFLKKVEKSFCRSETSSRYQRYPMGGDEVSMGGWISKLIVWMPVY